MAAILFVEDESNLRQNVSDLLQHHKHVVETAENGQVALSVLNRFRPDLILCDVMMPVMDGITLLERMREQAAYQHIPVIFLTAKAEPADRLLGLQKGAIDYLAKPFLSEELLLRIDNLLHYRAGLFRQLLQQEVGESTETDFQFVRRFTAVLDKQLGNPMLQSTEVADELGMSRSALQRHVKRHFQQTFVDVLKELRLRRACEYLVNSDYSLSTIAERCGFNSLSYFSRTFKQAYQTSPLKYRMARSGHQ